MFSLLEQHLGDEMPGEGPDASQVLEKDWGQLVDQAVGIRNDLQGQ
jgi:hypothetical protein